MKPRKTNTLFESKRKIESKIIRYDLERSVSLFLFSTKRNHRNDDPRSSIYCAVNAIIQRNAINEAYTMGDPCFAISLSIPHTLVQLICSTNKFPFVLEYCSPRSLREISRSRWINAFPSTIFRTNATPAPPFLLSFFLFHFQINDYYYYYSNDYQTTGKILIVLSTWSSKGFPSKKEPVRNRIVKKATTDGNEIRRGKLGEGEGSPSYFPSRRLAPPGI